MLHFISVLNSAPRWMEAINFERPQKSRLKSCCNLNSQHVGNCLSLNAIQLHSNATTCCSLLYIPHVSPTNTSHRFLACCLHGLQKYDWLHSMMKEFWNSGRRPDDCYVFMDVGFLLHRWLLIIHRLT
jgi:hypothetical protein